MLSPELPAEGEQAQDQPPRTLKEAYAQRSW